MASQKRNQKNQLFLKIITILLIISIHFDQLIKINAHTHLIEGASDQPRHWVDIEASDDSEDYDKIQNVSVRVGDGSKQISDINILLPLQNCKECRRAFKGVTALNGCYQWKVSHPSLIDLVQFKSKSHPDCANIAEVSSLQTKESKVAVWLTAVDQSSHQILTAQIKVAKIMRITIHSRFKQLSRGDKSQLYIRAYDDEDNAISTLDGFRFEWEIQSGADNIRRIPFKDSHMKAHGHAHLDDASWTQSDDFVLRAIQTGHTAISVRILEQGYESVSPASIKLTIVDPFIIVPRDQEILEKNRQDNEAFMTNDYQICILPTSEFDFKLQLVQKSQDQALSFKDIQLPSSQHFWSVEDPVYGSVEQNGRYHSSATPGAAQITVVDKKFPNNTGEIEIQVVEPFELRLQIADLSDIYKIYKNRQPLISGKDAMSLDHQLGLKNWDDHWVLVYNKTYLIKALLYSQDGRPITLTNNLEFESLFDERYFEVQQKSYIGSEVIIKVKNIANTHVAAKTVYKSFLKTIRSNSNQTYKFDKQKLKVEAEVTITGPVSILHPTNLILLPYLGYDKGEMWSLKAQGGSGTYSWSSENRSIAIVKEQSYVKSVTPGKTKITLRDHLNQNNFVQIDIEVRPVHHLQWLENRVEAHKQGESVILNVIAVDYKGRKFTNCSCLDLSYTVGAEFVQQAHQVNWYSIHNYIQSEQVFNTVQLKQRFEKQPEVIFESDLKKEEKLLDTEKQIIVHNNFGICNQILLKAQQEGASKIKSLFNDVISEDAQATSFDKLRTVLPTYSEYLADLYSNQQVDQENLTFGGYQPVNLGEDFKNKQFILAFGSYLNWELVGGGNLWDGYIEDYIANWRVEKLSGTEVDILEIKTPFLKRSETQVQIRCLNPKDGSLMNKSFVYKIVIELKGKTSRHFLNPKVHQESIAVSCEPPASQKILWSQKSTNQSELVALPGSRFINNLRTHYVLTESSHYIKLIMLDKNQHAFLNHQSIQTVITLSDNNLAALSNLTASDSNPLSIIYDKKEVKFAGKTGTLIIKSQSTAYKPEFLRAFDKTYKKSLDAYKIYSNVTDEMRVEIVEHVEVEPEFKSIYFQGEKNPFNFQIFRGSGDFAVTLNDTEIASFILRDRELIILPSKTGGLRIKVEDRKLPESPPVFASLLISDIFKVELESQGSLMEQDKSMNMTVTAFDSHQKQFDDEQYNKMDFFIDAVPTGVRRIDGLLSTQINKRIFKITGIEPGSYIVTSSSQKGLIDEQKQNQPERVTSEGNLIQVFRRLELTPATLLLTPNMKYTVSILGGPVEDSAEISRKFEILDTDIASIDEDREITAKKVGDTELVYKISYNKQSKDGSQQFQMLLSMTKLTVRVRLVTHIEIPNSRQRAVYAGSMVKLLAVLKYNDQIFSNGIAPVSFDWNCSHPNILMPHPSATSPGDRWKRLPDQVAGQNHLVQLAMRNQLTESKIIRNNLARNDSAQFVTSFNSSSVYSKALKSGEATLNVKMALEYPPAYKDFQNWFETSIVIKVQDKLAVSVPQFIADQDKQTHLYMLPPNSKTKIATNRQTKLRMGESREVPLCTSQQSNHCKDTQTPIIEILDDETVKTLDKYGRVTVIMEEADQAYGDQVVMLNILVTDIYSMAAEQFYEAVSLPIGSKMTIPLKFQNEHAHLFANDIEGIAVSFEASHPKVVTVELGKFNQSVQLKAEGPGESMVVVYLQNDPRIFDIFKVRVATIVEPSTNVHLYVGSEVQFKIVASKLDQLEAAGLTWFSSNQKVLDVNHLDGSAIARSEGKAEIKLQNSNNDITVSQVEVSKIQYAKVDDSADLILNTFDANDELRIRIRMYPFDIKPVLNYDGEILIKQNVNLECISDQPHHVKATSEVNNQEGYFCLVKYIGLSTIEASTPRTARITVKVSAPSSILQKSDKTSDSEPKVEVLAFDVKLTGTIIVGKDARRGVRLTHHQRQKIIKVLSLSDFSVQKTLGDDKLKAKVIRQNQNSNIHELYLTVPKSVNESFSTEIVLQSLHANIDKVSLKVTFDVNDLTKPVSDSQQLSKYATEFDPKRGDQRPKYQRLSPDTSQAQRSSKHNEIFKDQANEDKQPQGWLGTIILSLLILFISLTIFDSLKIVFKPLFFAIDCCKRLFQNRGSYEGDRTRSFYSARDNDYGYNAAGRSGSAADGIKPVRGKTQAFQSPDTKILHDPGFRRSAGSVISPHSKYQRQADSIFQQNKF